jgi:uncharacterized membrane protein YkvA (DUF1232 family)
MSTQGWSRRQAARRRQDLRSIVRQARVLLLALRHPQTPWRARVVAGCAAAYLLSPIQVIPTFIPVIGQLDDLAVLLVGMKLLRKLLPENILAECEARATSPRFVPPIRYESTTLVAFPKATTSSQNCSI